MFESIPRDTLIRKKDGGVFLVKTKIEELHSLKMVPCYLGYLYVSEVDYMTSKCYIDQIHSVIGGV